MVGPRAQLPDRRRRRPQAARPADPCRSSRWSSRTTGARSSTRARSARRRHRGDPALDLAGDLPRAARAGRARTARRSSSSTTAALAERLALRLNELRPGSEAEIARSRPPRLARPRGARRRRGAAQGGRAPVPGRDLVARARDRHGRGRPGDPGRVAEVGRARAAADRPRRPRVGDVAEGRIFPKFRADLLECAVVARAMRGGEIEATVVPRNPLDVLAQQIVAIARRRAEDRGRQRRRAVRARPRRTRSPSSRRAPARERARHARRPLPVRRVRRAAPADRLGPDRGHDPRPRGRAPARGHQRRHDPRPRPVRGHAARTAAASASSTRRWSTRRAPARRSCSAPRPGGSRRSPATA